MQDFKIIGSKKSPEIIFTSSQNYLSINGRSVMSNLDDDFYNPIFELFKELIKEKITTFTLEFNLDYFNTSSHLSIIKILKKVDEISSKNISSNVIWIYNSDDEEMKEIGEEMQKFCSVEFTYKVVD